MAKIEITPEKMKEIAEGLGKKIEEWNEAVKGIYAAYNELAPQFEGEASERLKAQMAADQPRYNALSSLMTEYKNEIIKAMTEYVNADNDAAYAVGSNN